MMKSVGEVMAMGRTWQVGRGGGAGGGLCGRSFRGRVFVCVGGGGSMDDRGERMCLL